MAESHQIIKSFSILVLIKIFYKQYMNLFTKLKLTFHLK